VKYSFMSFSTPEQTLGEMIDLAKRHGYDGLEPRVTSNHKHGIEPDASADARRTAKTTAEDSGIELACVATSCRYADPDSAPSNVELTKRCIELAADVGSTRIRVFGGNLGSDIDRTGAITLVAECLGSLGLFAQEHGVSICVETHDAWTDPKHVAAVIGRMVNPAVGVNWDVMHPVRTGAATMEESFETLKPWIKHLHIHDGDDNGLAPIGSGDYDHRAVVKCLDSIGYDGYLSGEWINWDDPFESHLPREVAKMREYEAELA
jgi:sugar phosphate isomerase/epimerase